MALMVSYSLNEAAVTRARRLVDAHQYVLDSNWGDVTMPEETRNGVITETRRLLREFLSVEGEATVDIAFRSDAWRTRRRRSP